MRNLLGALYAERVAHSVAVAAEPDHLFLALTAGLLLETDHAAAVTAPAAPVALLNELPAFTRCTEQPFAALQAISHPLTRLQLSCGGELLTQVPAAL